MTADDIVQALDLPAAARVNRRVPKTLLAVLLAVMSSLRNRPLSKALVVFGEVGLAGEIRPVPGGPERLQEAAKHGFTRAVVLKGNAPSSKRPIKGLEVITVERLGEALEASE